MGENVPAQADGVVALDEAGPDGSQVGMRVPLLGAVVLLLLAAGDFLVYVSQDGMECQGDACSALAEITGAVFFPMVILAVLLALFGAVRGLLGAWPREPRLRLLPPPLRRVPGVVRRLAPPAPAAVARAGTGSARA
jgi:hypothetical protein